MGARGMPRQIIAAAGMPNASDSVKCQPACEPALLGRVANLYMLWHWWSLMGQRIKHLRCRCCGPGQEEPVKAKRELDRSQLRGQGWRASSHAVVDRLAHPGSTGSPCRRSSTRVALLPGCSQGQGKLSRLCMTLMALLSTLQQAGKHVNMHAWTAVHLGSCTLQAGKRTKHTRTQQWALYAMPCIYPPGAHSCMAGWKGCCCPQSSRQKCPRPGQADSFKAEGVKVA